jgi:NADP-dependent 3-hydroxy acid dehydrogenase YdfG
MKTFENTTAFVTGAASGIGLAITEALTARGANVMMGDINMEQLTSAADDIRKAGGNVETILCDVRKSEDVHAAAKATIAAFGKVHMVFNNAGVSLSGRPGNLPLKDWQWIVDINLMGVIYGVEAFVPLMAQHGEPSHIINTASMAGHFTIPGMAPYHATKFAVVGYSESLKVELEKTNIGVSVLCPTWVKSNIYNTGDKRPTAVESGVDASTAPRGKLHAMVKGLVDNGMGADVFAGLVLKSIQAKRFYVFNDREVRHEITKRRDAILKDFDACLDDLGM